jgi:hypothetical protein
MEALKKMEIVWPSAGRALELLAGSKVHKQEPEFANLSNHPDRHKRLAEQALDSEDAYDRDHLSNHTTDYLTARSQTFDNAQYADGQHLFESGGNFQPGAATVNGGMSFFPSYERWPSDNDVSHPFPGTISTSVLPQLYSTGLVDEHAAPGVRFHANTTERGHAPNSRYPQYWNDYSTFPQLGTAYGNMPSLHDQSQVQQQQIQTPFNMYLPDQYHIYSEFDLKLASCETDASRG